MKQILVFLVSFSCYAATSQGILDSLPDSLIENSNEIILNDETRFEIKDINKSVLSRRYKAIVLNKKASSVNRVLLHYDRFRQITDAAIRVLNMEDSEIEKINLKDFGDYSTKGTDISSDSRARHHNVVYDKYPYIIEVSYEITYLGSMFYPIWIPQSDEHQAVLISTLKVESNITDGFRHKSINVRPKSTKLVEGQQSTIWEVSSLAPFEFEAYSHSITDYTPVVYTAPNLFQMDGYYGNLSSWDKFAAWINQLNAERNTLTPEEILFVQREALKLNSKIERVKYVYEYLQNNTRYVSIQLGIGGWQPFETGFVHQNKYGDCKALSFYTKSLLESIDISSYYTLINAGPYARETFPDFPNAHFNHAILTVPMEHDTIWLECTSQTNPFGYLGTFTSNRNALMISPEGGHIIKTRSYSAEENTQVTVAQLEILEDGSANVDLSRSYSGLEIENKSFSSISLESSAEQRKWFYDRHNWGNLSLISLKMAPPSTETVPSASFQAKVVHENAARANANRLFFKPFTFTNINYMTLPDKDRKKPIEIRYGYSQIDSLQVQFPATFYPESVFQDASLKNQYGYYERTVQRQDEHFLIIRRFTLYEGEYSPKEYESFRDFITKVQRNDRTQLVMVNKT